MGQNLAGMTATGTFNDATTGDITSQVAWTVSDTSIATIGSTTGLLTIQPAGEIWGATIGVTATLSPGTPGTGSLLVIASDSGSVAPRMPQLDSHWAALGLSPWGSYWGMQEPSGSNFVGSGSAAFTLTKNDGGGQGILYQQPTGLGSGWVRTSISISGTQNQRIAAASGVGPDARGQSVGFLAYGVLGPSAVSTMLMGILANTAANTVTLMHQSQNSHCGAPQIFTNVATRQLVGPNTHQHDDRVHPFLLINNVTTGEIWAMTDEGIQMSGGMQALTVDEIKGFGAKPGNTCASASLTYFAMATGSIVEALCSQSASADFLSRLGWSVKWKTCPTDSGTIKLPFLPGHWSELGIQPWTATWNLQDPGSPARSFDVWSGKDDDAWSLVQGAALSYERQLPSPGWNRRSVMITQNSAQRMTRVDVVNPPIQFDPTGSFAVLAYAFISGSNSDVQLMGVGSAAAGGPPTQCVLNIRQNNYLPILYCAGATVTGTTAFHHDRVHPLLLVYDKTNSRVKAYTDLEKITGSFNALTIVNSLTASVGFGATAAGALVGASGSYTYFAFTTGSQAEQLSDDGKASSFLKTMGWSIPW